MLAGADRERFLHRRRQCVVRARVEVLVVRPAEVGVDVEDALHANDVRLGRKPAAQVVHRADVLRCERRRVRVIDHPFDRSLVPTRELADQDVVTLAGLVRWRQRVDVTGRHAQLQEGSAGDDQHDQRRHQHKPRPSHDPDRHRMPRPGPCGPARSQPRDDPLHPSRPPIDQASEDSERRGQEGQSVKHGDGDHDCSGRSHRGHERALKEQHRGQADGDRDAREGDGPPGRGHGDRDRFLATCAS